MSALTDADETFANSFTRMYGDMVDFILDDEQTQATRFSAMRELNIYLNGIGFAPDDEDSDIDMRFTDCHLYVEGSADLGLTVDERASWFEYIRDSRDA